MVTEGRTSEEMVFTAGELLFTSKGWGVVLQNWYLVQEHSLRLWKVFNGK